MNLLIGFHGLVAAVDDKMITIARAVFDVVGAATITTKEVLAGYDSHSL